MGFLWWFHCFLRPGIWTTNFNSSVFSQNWCAGNCLPVSASEFRKPAEIAPKKCRTLIPTWWNGRSIQTAPWRASIINLSLKRIKKSLSENWFIAFDHTGLTTIPQYAAIVMDEIFQRIDQWERLVDIISITTTVSRLGCFWVRFQSSQSLYQPFPIFYPTTAKGFSNNLTLLSAKGWYGQLINESFIWVL